MSSCAKADSTAVKKQKQDLGFTVDVQIQDTVKFECVASSAEEAGFLAEMIYPDGVVGDIRAGYDSKLCPFCKTHCGDQCEEALAGGFDDKELSVNLLSRKYSYWGEHPDHSLECWRAAICNDDTRAAYWHWVWMQLSDSKKDEESCV